MQGKDLNELSAGAIVTGDPPVLWQREMYDVATRPLGHRQKRRSPGLLVLEFTVSEGKSLAEQIECYRRALKASELAELLSVSKITVFKLAKAGRIPCFHVGTCVRFDPRAVAKWLRNM